MTEQRFDELVEELDPGRAFRLAVLYHWHAKGDLREAIFSDPSSRGTNQPRHSQLSIKYSPVPQSGLRVAGFKLRAGGPFFEIAWDGAEIPATNRLDLFATPRLLPAGGSLRTPWSHFARFDIPTNGTRANFVLNSETVLPERAGDLAALGEAAFFRAGTLLDTDGDGLTDAYELLVSQTDPQNNDSDWDYISDYDELIVYGTDPFYYDTDRDGLSDYEELMAVGANPFNADTDGDGFSDWWELLYAFGSVLNPLIPDAPDSDFDGDGLTLREEHLRGTDPNDSDCDNDGAPDGQTHAQWAAHPLFGDELNPPNVLVSLDATVFQGSERATLIVNDDLRLPLGAVNSWALRLDEAATHAISVSNKFGYAVKLTISGYYGSSQSAPTRALTPSGPPSGVYPPLLPPVQPATSTYSWRDQEKALIIHDEHGFTSPYSTWRPSGVISLHFATLSFQEIGRGGGNYDCADGCECGCFVTDRVKYAWFVDGECAKCMNIPYWTSEDGLAYWDENDPVLEITNGMEADGCFDIPNPDVVEGELSAYPQIHAGGCVPPCSCCEFCKREIVLGDDIATTVDEALHTISATLWGSDILRVFAESGIRRFLRLNHGADELNGNLMNLVLNFSARQLPERVTPSSKRRNESAHRSFCAR